MLGRKEFKQFHVPTKLNPSDDPSRNVALRDRIQGSDLIEKLVTAESCRKRDKTQSAGRADLLCLECFAGAGGLSKALVDSDVDTLPPMEAHPARTVYVKHHDLDDPAVYARIERLIKSGNLFYVHFGVPCKSWSSLQHFNSSLQFSSSKQCP